MKHHKLGASWEGFALEQVLQASHQSKNIFYWAVHQGAEIDLILILGGQKIGFELTLRTDKSVGFLGLGSNLPNNSTS